MADYDLLIIGAGFAGLTVARELRGSGLRIALLEARERLGGRAWCQTWHGYPIEMGGGWVNWTQPHVWSEITRYGLELFERPGWPKNPAATICAEVDGQLVTRPMADNMRALRPLIEDYAADARRVFPRPYDPAYAMDAIAEIDHLSAQDRLDQMDMPPLQRAMMSRLLAMQCHGHPKDGAYVEFLRWYALNHFSIDAYLSSASRLQFRGGTQSLLEAMLAESDADVICDWPVERVQQSEDGVIAIHANGERVSARKAVLATPLNVWKHIHFSPALSDGKRALSEAEHSGKGQKLYVRVKGHWPELNLAADAEAAISTVIVQEARDDETLLVVMLVNDQLAPYSHAQMQSALRAFCPGLEVIDMLFHNWTDDRYALGTWCSYRPGQTSRYLQQAQSPEGHLHFAGADIASGWRGFFDGAIESGMRVATQVAAALQGRE